MFFHHIPACNRTNASEYNKAFFIEWTPEHILLVPQWKKNLIVPPESNTSFFSNSSKAKKGSLSILEILFPIFLMVFQDQLEMKRGY